MSHRKEVCQYGELHWQCRCPGNRPVTQVICDRPERHRPAFEPGDRVRMHNTGDIGTVMPLDVPDGHGGGVTRVNFDSQVIPPGLVVMSSSLRLAGTRCIPFEAMSTPHQWSHLRLAHNCDERQLAMTLRIFGHEDEESMRAVFWRAHNQFHAAMPTTHHPHTHRKATP